MAAGLAEDGHCDLHPGAVEEAALDRGADGGRGQPRVAHGGHPGAQRHRAVGHRMEQAQRPLGHQHPGEVDPCLHAEVDVHVHETRQQGEIVALDDARVGGDADIAPGSAGDDPIAVDDDGGGLDGVAAGPVDEAVGDDRQRCRVAHGAPSCLVHVQPSGRGPGTPG